ncbi:hypothetical protein GCM10023093_05260 [Nemorincola caseinilytica]|uniref:Lipoprotein n=2 Tax=Nemorincola caseinilytica TaxID=2054315 RepID=A0ABP8N8M6_9BACT
MTIIAGLAAMGACRKKKGPADVDTAKPDSSLLSQLNMSALVNTVEWKTDSAYSYKVVNSGGDTSIFNLMVIATQEKDNQRSTINISITDFKGKGTYKIDPPINTATYYSGNIRHYASTGNFVVVTDTGSLYKGTFNFVADTVSVIDGKFSIAKP